MLGLDPELMIADKRAACERGVLMKRLRLWDDQGVKKMEDLSKRSAKAFGGANGKAPGGANGTSALPWVQHPAQAVIHNGDLGSQRRRIALYSHDTMGLGHKRRNLLIAQALAYSPAQPVTLIITGVGEASTFMKPSGVDYLALPALRKDLDGHYDSRSLHVSLQELITLRARVIRTALEAFEPDVLIVDNVPRGAVGELNPTLAYLRARGHTRCVLGLRDVLDDPTTVYHEWRRAANEDTIREYYDMVWVYGDPAVYNPVREYHFPPDVAAKVRYAGYLDQRLRLKFTETEGSDPLAALSLPPGRLVLCCVGGGQDGGRLAEAFAAAQLPPQTNGVLLTGPFMPREMQQRLRQCVAAQPRLRVLEFVREPALLLQQADRVIAMGGYNTVCEVLSFEKQALIVPRVRPRREQLIRAERLHELGLLDVLHPDQLSPSTLTEWLARDLGPLPRIHDRIDLSGLTRLPHLLGEVLAGRRYPAQSPLHEGSL